MPPNRLPILANLDGNVIVGSLAAVELAPHLRRRLLELTRRDGLRFSEATWAAVEAIETVAREGRFRLASASLDDALDSSRSGEGQPDTMANMNSDMVTGLTAAGKILGCTKQAVADRIERGTLPATRDHRGHYVFARENLEYLPNA